ncbi:hypothetical protein NE237_032370 [Protea cynaroides]|uniref:RRM domain-containing protein n=1 Tax=Protea cynaroides TaxID=273540 RepID=A0A9Q0L2Y5_9MAGN|nr:hypothetical protein NE237_032370 [Protea cynaroides]
MASQLLTVLPLLAFVDEKSPFVQNAEPWLFDSPLRRAALAGQVTERIKPVPKGFRGHLAASESDSGSWALLFHCGVDMKMVTLARRILPHNHTLLRSYCSSPSSPSPASNKLFVGGISRAADEKSLKDAFSLFGEVTEVRIMYDKDTGRSRGFGFVYFLKDDDAKCAKDAMDGKALLGRPLRISYALEKVRGGPVVVPRMSRILVALVDYDLKIQSWQWVSTGSQIPEGFEMLIQMELNCKWIRQNESKTSKKLRFLLYLLLDSG